jgi:hypothetical protein
MRALSLLLKTVAPIFLVVGALHLVLGVGADVMLGARVPPDVVADPALSSQNRFYGVAFSLYGVLLFVCAADLGKYATVLRCVLWAMFAAGAARLVAIAAHGLPPVPILVLMGLELLPPPVLHVWLGRALRGPPRPAVAG